MTLNATIGEDFQLLDEPVTPAVAELTGRPHLLSTNGPAAPVTTSRANTGNATADGQIEVLLRGGASEVVIQGYGGSGGLPTLAVARTLLPAGPGSVVAPEAIASADHVTLMAGWGGVNGLVDKVALLNGSSGLSDANVTTLATTDIAGGDGRGAGLWVDWFNYAATAGPVAAPATLGIAAAIARNDRDTKGNTGLPFGGINGVLKGALSAVNTLRTKDQLNTLAGSQVNCIRQVGTEFRNYGIRSLANLTTLPDWWDLPGARVAMDYKFRCAALSLQTDFLQVDASRKTIDLMVALRTGVLLDLWRKGALYGLTAADAFRIVSDASVNPDSQLSMGFVQLKTIFKTSKGVERTLDQTIRRPLTASVND